MALAIDPVEGLEALSTEGGVQLGDCAWSLSALVMSVGRIHQHTHDANERLRQHVRTCRRLSEDLAQHMFDPRVARAAIVLEIRVAVLEEPGEIAAAAIDEEAGIVVAADHPRNLRDAARFEARAIPVANVAFVAGAAAPASSTVSFTCRRGVSRRRRLTPVFPCDDRSACRAPAPPLTILRRVRGKSWEKKPEPVSGNEKRPGFPGLFERARRDSNSRRSVP